MALKRENEVDSINHHIPVGETGIEGVTQTQPIPAIRSEQVFRSGTLHYLTIPNSKGNIEIKAGAWFNESLEVAERRARVLAASMFQGNSQSAQFLQQYFIR